MRNYVVATSKDWFSRHPKSNEYNKLSIYYIKDKDELTIEILDKINPRYIFFPHWSWIVNSEIYDRYECIIFHTAPLPYGRGGSPIQNLILKGYKKSPICALRMSKTLDGGPIYKTIEVSLEGNIDEIFARISTHIEDMIIDISKFNPEPIIQKGQPFYFKRLTYENNEIDSSLSLGEIYDRIRMVDGEDYERSYINFGEYKIEFKNAEIKDNQIYANIRLFNKNK